MSRNIPSDRVAFGRNHDLGSLADDRYVRCGKCGFICHLDRDRRTMQGDRSGDGINGTVLTSTPIGTIYNPDLTYDDADTYYDGRHIIDPVVANGCPFCGTLLYDK